MMIELSPRTSFSLFGGDAFQGHESGVKKGARVDYLWPLKHQFLPFGCEYLKNGKLKCYVSIRD